MVLHAESPFSWQNTHLVIDSLSLSVLLIRIINRLSSYGSLEEHCLERLQCSIVFCVDIAHATINHLLEHCLLLYLTLLLDVSCPSQEINVFNW
jgi:hypothetical protein